MSAGIFITFEGTEGGGKSTQIKLLADRLRSSGKTVLVTREPGGTPLGEEVRQTLKHSPAGQGMCPEAELLLFNACRAQLVREVITPALLRGDVVLSDRFFDSTFAYQSFGRGLAMDAVQAVVEFAVGSVRPHRTYYLRVPIEVSEQRRSARAASEGMPKPDRFEEADRTFFTRVEQGFETLANQEPKRILTIEAARSIGEVHEAIWEDFSHILGASVGGSGPGR